jgi:hypothetical protein
MVFIIGGASLNAIEFFKNYKNRILDAGFQKWGRLLNWFCSPILKELLYEAVKRHLHLLTI